MATQKVKPIFENICALCYKKIENDMLSSKTTFDALYLGDTRTGVSFLTNSLYTSICVECCCELLTG